MGYKKIEDLKTGRIQVQTTENVRDELLKLAHKERCSLSSLCERAIIHMLIVNENE